MLGNIGDLFVKCMRQVTKGHLYYLLGVLYYYVIYRHRAQSVLRNAGKDHRLGKDGGNFDISNYNLISMTAQCTR